MNNLLAQATEYLLLEPLPGITKPDGVTATFATYIPGIFSLMIGIAGLLAVIMIVYGGLQYLTTEAFQGKGDAKETIKNALWGLLLTIASWLILNTISPNLVKFDLNIDKQQIGEELIPPVNILGEVEPQASGTVVRGPSFNKAWNNDSVVRNMLRATNNKITVNKNNCSTIGQVNCTSVANLSARIKDRLTTIAQDCGTDCKVEITGGTEYWLHGNGSTEISENTTKHKPAGNVIDLSSTNASLNAYIMKGEDVSNQSGCATGTKKYKMANGAIFVRESDHWHACF